MRLRTEFFNTNEIYRQLLFGYMVQLPSFHWPRSVGGVKGEHTVYFATGNYSISGQDRNALADLAKKALTYQKGYVIQVAAFADSVGTASSNQLLSKERAQAVVAYLLQECSVPVGRIVAPGAMGETNPAASNETSSGRSENRRAEVKLLVNKGIGGAGGEN